MLHPCPSFPCRPLGQRGGCRGVRGNEGTESGFRERCGCHHERTDRTPKRSPARGEGDHLGRSPDLRVGARRGPSRAFRPVAYAGRTRRSQLRGQSRICTAFPILRAGPEPRLERLNAGRLTAQVLRSCHLPARGFGAAWEWMAPAMGMHGTDLGNAALRGGRRRIEAGFPGDSLTFHRPNPALERDAEIE